MSTHSKVDLSTLGWVKTEIDETLKQARLALESFAENPSDKTRLRFCVTHLHQVVGTLLMVELDGAAMLAKETEALADAVINDKVTPDSKVFDALTRGILTLPDYLARLQYGQLDVPLKHIALINELRAARNAPAISELELFAPDLSVRPPLSERQGDKLEETEYRELAKQLRGTFQPALLNWLRDTTNQQPLTAIADVFEQLQAKTGNAVLEQLFWVAGGLIEALIDDGLEVNVARKKPFARIDQQIKKVIDGAEKPVLRTSSESLTCAILWEVAQTKSQGPRITQLKRAFDLEFLLTGGAPEEPAAGNLPTPEALQSVSAALGKEIEAAQDLMSTYFDPESRGSVSLEPLIESFRKMSGTLDMLNVPMLKSLVDELSGVCRAILDNQLENAEMASMPMAEALLMVENSTRDITRPPAEWKRQIEDAIHRLHALLSPNDAYAVPAAEGFEVSDGELTESDYKQLLNVVGGEVGINLSRIEEALEGFAANTSHVQSLDDVPQLLSQILGAMQILGQSRAAELVEATKQHVEDIRHGAIIADSAIMDGLAVCVGTIGAFVEGLRADRQNLEALIDSAFTEMQAALASGHGQQRDPAMLIDGVRLSLESWLDDSENGAARETLAQQLDELTQLAKQRGQEKIEKISAEMNHLLTFVADDPARLSEEFIDTLKQSFTAMSVLAGRRMAVRTAPPTAAPEAEQESEIIPLEPFKTVQAAAPPAPPVPSAPPARSATDAEFDAEIMEIFIEDARDVLQNIKNKFVLWRDDTDNQNALTELRRGYHTLKGSGRMVGASEVAEFSWAVENILNRVREGKIVPSAEIIDLLQQAQEALPRMVDVLAGGPPHGIDVEGLRETAQALAQPGSAAATKPVTPSATRPPERNAAPASADREGDLPKLDGTLLEIFTTEALGNIANIRQQIAACREAGGACFVSETLFRSVHTLQGNARSLGIAVMFEPCAEIEKLLHVLKSEGIPLSESYLELTSRFETHVSELVNLLNSGAASSGDLRRQFADLTRDLRAENKYLVKMESAGEHPAPPLAELPAEAPLDEETEFAPEAVAPPEHIEMVRTPPVAAKAPVPTSPPDGTPTERVVLEEIDPELLEIFQEEASDILNSIEEALTRWRARPEDRGLVQDLKRSLHTLKGGARMAGAMTMGNLSHNTETLLRNIEEGKIYAERDIFDLFDEAHDMLVVMLDRARGNMPVPDVHELNAKLLALASGQPVPEMPLHEALTAPMADAPPEISDTGYLEETAVEPAESSGVTPLAEIPAPATETAAEIEERRQRQEDEERQAQQWPEKMERRGQVRVDTGLLNELVNYAGEVSISRSRMEQQIYSFRDNLSELTRNITRFREQIRELEIQSESQILYRMEQESGAEGRAADFDPLEFDRFSRLQQLSRSLAESLHDLGTIQNNMGNFVGEAEAVLQQQARINTELQEGLMRTRMVSFSTQGARLRHIVRQTGRELGKRVELNLDGAEVEIDRNVLERMIGPFEHMIRNSIDHGIENETVRRKKGKAPIGRITIASSQEGSEVIIRFSDDGEGLNIKAIRTKAIERGLMSADADLSEEELIQFILVSGFSTADKITHVSGRGVGMDVVHSEVKQLGGSMSVDTELGVGTTFIIRLPLTLSITQALMVYVGDQLFAMPLGSVVNIIEFPIEKIDSISVGKNPLLSHNEQVYPYMHLGQRLGIPSVPRNGKKVPVLLARTGTREVAIQIDGLGGTREVVIKSVGPQLSEIKGLAGATILGDGRVILILDVPGLWFREDVIHFEHRPAGKVAQEVRARPVIMVVDDSLTVRKVTSKHLQKRGMDVLVAKDGIDAVEQLRDHIPDVMLVDIEMPRMDGYELTMRVRSDETLKHIPIIMITSRAGAKHRQKAFDLGVDMYMSKPYQEEELFRNIDRLLSKGREQ